MIRSHYDAVLEELRFKKDKLASEYITELYFILSEEEHLSPEECRDKIESDCSDIWSEGTIRKYLPPEAKNKTKRKAGKISAEVKKKVKEQQQQTTNQAIKPLVVANRIRDTNVSGQFSTLIEGDHGNKDNDNENCIIGNDNDHYVGLIPTENCPIGDKKLESDAFQQAAEEFDDDDYFSVLLTDRLKDEAFEIMGDPLMASNEAIDKSVLLLSPELAGQIFIEVNASQSSEIIPKFELKHNGRQIVSVRKLAQ